MGESSIVILLTAAINLVLIILAWIHGWESGVKAGRKQMAREIGEKMSGPLVKRDPAQGGQQVVLPKQHWTRWPRLQ